MSECPKNSGCLFFSGELDNMPSTAGIYRSKYCKFDYLRCARYMVIEKLGNNSVPQDLLPYMRERVQNIISAG